MNFEQKTWLITGGSGSLGSRIVREILEKYNPKEVRVLSRSEALQVRLKESLRDDRVVFVIGDVRSKPTVRKAAYGVNYVIHTAAMKHVPICEKNVYECIWTNLIGTENIIEAALAENAEKVVAISTDKASRPGNAYGLTKALMERLMISSEQSKGNRRTQFICTRFGNMAGSAGSVIELFEKQIEAKKDINLTDPDMTRFFITIGDAVKTIFYAFEECRGGEIVVPKMFSLKMGNLVKALLEIHNSKLKVNVIGARAGEKKHEYIITEDEILRTSQINDYYVIFPNEKKFHIPGKEITSLNVKEMAAEGIKELIERMKKEEAK